MNLKGLFNDRQSLKLGLLPTVLRKRGAFNDDVNQDSLIRILLNIDELQSEVMKILIEEITRLAPDSSNNEESTLFLRLSLTALSNLPCIKSDYVIKLVDILDIASFECRIEILNAIPNIIPNSHSQSDRIGKEISKLLREDVGLTAAIIDCLNSLNLSIESKIEIEDLLIDFLNDSNAIKFFAVLYDFLVTNSTKTMLFGVLERCRNSLGDILITDDLNEEFESFKVIIFTKIRFSMLIKEIYDGYLLFLSKTKEYKPIDLLFIILLHSCKNETKIESLFKKLIKDNHLKIDYLEDFYRKYLNKFIIDNYLDSIKSLTSCLLPEYYGEDFSSKMFQLTFDNEYLNFNQRRGIIETLIMLMKMNGNSRVLKILLILTENVDKMKQNVHQIMLLLDNLDVYHLNDAKIVFDVLLTLTCSDENLSGIKNELNILIRKQLTSSKVLLRQYGLIGAVLMLKHVLIKNKGEEIVEDFDKNLNFSSDIKECIKLFNLAQNSCENSTILTGLFYDQLSDVIVANELNKNFLKWLNDKITLIFQSKYLIETIPASLNENIDFVEYFSLNAAEEINSKIYINIGGLTINQNRFNNIEILPAFFRLLRLLHFIDNNGELSSIDAVLGSGVILPEFDDVNVNSYSIEELKSISDCLYHCVNWFREIINAFVAQKSKNIRRKVLERLKNLIYAEKCLNDVMVLIPQHKLPFIDYFNSFNSEDDGKNDKSVKNKGKNVKKIKLDNTTNKNSTILSVNLKDVKEVNNKSNKLKKSLNINYNFREIDTSVMILLKYPLKLDFGDVEDVLLTQEQLTQSNQQTYIDLSCFDFLIKDLTIKLELISRSNQISKVSSKISSKSSSKSLKSSIILNNQIKPIEIITDCVKLLPKIFNKFQVILNRLKLTLEETDFVYDHQSLFTPEMNGLKSTFSTILKCFYLIFDWDGFKTNKHNKLLKETVISLLQETVNLSNKETVNLSNKDKSISINKLSLMLSNELKNYSEYALNLDSAFYLIKIIDKLYEIGLNNDIKKNVTSSCFKLLSRSWFDDRLNLETGREHFVRLDYLISCYLNGANVKTLGGLISTLQEQILTLKSKEDSLEMFRSVTKSNFHVLYKRFCICLFDRLKIEIVSLTNNEHLVLWKTVSLSLQGLMSIVKIQESRSNLIHFLKKSIDILKVYLTHGIPIMEILLKTKTDRVIEILKNLQLTIRFLHHLCCHSKIIKDTSLIAHVPRCRLTLETFVFRIKAMLVANDCSAAFWLGNLRNRDIHGEEILSQNSVSTDGNDGSNINVNVNDGAGDEGDQNDDEDEELPPDESDNDIDFDDNDNDDNVEMMEQGVEGVSEAEERSASEIFD